jgi:bifunctional UDP-N-acetylglucosamine pyrophosphorylase/glucosamine-1-phosphate N-acetyltransferase
MAKVEVIILAAGHGKRMQSETPKALMPLSGKPLIAYVLDAVALSKVSKNPIIVIGQKRDYVLEALGDGYRYAVQDEQLGTGHAVRSAESIVDPKAQTVVVLYADQPFITAETIMRLVNTKKETKAKIVMATVPLPDFDDWRSVFLGFSRVKRDAAGKIIGVVEAKDASEEEKEILEVNPAYFCFDRAWLFEKLPELKNKNAQGEYYLTDLVKVAFLEGLSVPSVPISPREAVGTNSKEDLSLAEKVL